MTLFIGSLQLGLIYGFLAIGIYISFRIMNIPDLTAEGSFTFGLVVAAVFADLGHPILGIVLALAAGALAGVVTGALNVYLRIPAILVTASSSLPRLFSGFPTVFQCSAARSLLLPSAGSIFSSTSSSFILFTSIPVIFGIYPHRTCFSRYLSPPPLFFHSLYPHSRHLRTNRSANAGSEGRYRCG